MLIAGMQKLSLLDYPGHTCCTIFTQGCNLRCPYCHNASLVGAEAAALAEHAAVFDYLEGRKTLHDGVCVSGGEPLLQKGLSEFLHSVKSLGLRVKLDTNGCYPERLGQLLQAGLIDYVAMDIKSSPKRYAKAVGVEDFDTAAVLRSVELLRSGDVEHEFRTTVVRPIHTEEDFYDIADWLEAAPAYYMQCFEDSGDILKEGLSAFEPAEMQRFLDVVKAKIPAAQLRGL